jgi:hypothetical protein
METSPEELQKAEPSSRQEASPRKPEVKHQQIKIVNPNRHDGVLPSEALLDIWFIENEIVIGGFGWYEYNDYLRIQKMKPLEVEE